MGTGALGHDFAWGVLDHLPDERSRQDFLGFDVPDHRPVGLLQSEWQVRPTENEEEGDASLDLRDAQADPPPNKVPDEEPPAVSEPPREEAEDDHEQYEKTQDFDEDDFDAQGNLKPHGTSSSQDGDIADQERQVAKNMPPEPTDEPKTGKADGSEGTKKPAYAEGWIAKKSAEELLKKANGGHLSSGPDKGSRECVALVKHAVPDIGQANKWEEGAKVSHTRPFKGCWVLGLLQFISSNGLEESRGHGSHKKLQRKVH